MIVRIAAAAALASMFAACAAAPTAYELTPRAANGQDLTTIAGLGPGTLLESRRPGGVVVVRAAEQFSDHGASFAVAVQNAGSAPVAFGPANVVAHSGGRLLHIYTPEELDAGIQGNARQILKASERIDDPSNPRRDIETASLEVSRQESFNNFGGCPAGEARCLFNSGDLGYSYRHERTDRLLNLETSFDMAQKLTLELPELQKTLRAVSVEPGAMGGGLVVVEHPPRGGVVDITVTFAGQAHTFSYDARPVQKE